MGRVRVKRMNRFTSRLCGNNQNALRLNAETLKDVIDKMFAGNIYYRLYFCLTHSLTRSLSLSLSFLRPLPLQHLHTCDCLCMDWVGHTHSKQYRSLVYRIRCVCEILNRFSQPTLSLFVVLWLWYCSLTNTKFCRFSKFMKPFDYKQAPNSKVCWAHLVHVLTLISFHFTKLRSLFRVLSFN